MVAESGRRYSGCDLSLAPGVTGWAGLAESPMPENHMFHPSSQVHRLLDRRVLDRIAIHALLGVTVALYLWAAVHLA
jgi:hypothetical protein